MKSPTVSVHLHLPNHSFAEHHRFLNALYEFHKELRKICPDITMIPDTMYGFWERGTISHFTEEPADDS